MLELAKRSVEVVRDDVADGEARRRHIAQLLAAVERETTISQRMLAAQMGVALGLINTYVKHCVRTGLIKVQAAPRRRYAYFLTPTGIAEKSRLTAEYLSWSLSFFRRARAECAVAVAEVKTRGWRHTGLAGGGDLAEIAVLCAAEQGLAIAGLVDPLSPRPSVLGVRVFAQAAAVTPRPDGWIVTSIDDPQQTYDALVRQCDAERVCLLPMLSVRTAVERPSA
jgi:hypothetical protein